MRTSGHIDNARVRTGFLAVCLLGISLSLLPTSKNRAPVLGEQYQLVFHEVQGLTVGSTVTLGGVEAGRVINIDFAPQGSWKELNKGQGERPVVLVTVGLAPGFHLPPFSGYKIDANLKGWREVNIIPGEGEARVSPNSIINAELDSTETDRISRTLYDIEDLVLSTRDVRRQFIDPKFQRGLKDSVSNFRFYSRELLARGQHAQAQVHEAERQLDRQQRAMLEQIDRIDAQLSNARQTLNGGLVAKARQGTQSVRSQIAALDHGLDGMLTQAQSYTGQFRSYVRSFDDSPLGRKRAKAMADQAHALAEQMDEYAALAHDFRGLSSDPQVQKDLRGKSKDLKSRSVSLKQASAALESLAKGLQFLNSVAPAVSPTPTP